MTSGRLTTGFHDPHGQGSRLLKPTPGDLAGRTPLRVTHPALAVA